MSAPSETEAAALMLVTGASGFVGRHLVGALASAGLSVRAVSRADASFSGNQVEAIRVDSYTSERLAKSMEGVDTVFHLAGRAHRIAERLPPEEAQDVFRRGNVDSTVAVAQAARGAGVRRVVLASSIGVNGSCNEQPFTEVDSPHPTEPYAYSKLEAEHALQRELAGSTTQFVILRLPLVYGPDAPGNFGQLLNLVANAPVVPLGGIHAPRTLLGIGNLVDAMLVAARHPAASGRTFLLGDGQDTSVAQIVSLLAAGLGRSHRVLSAPPLLLEALATLAGRRAAWRKLSAPLRVDASEFGRATGWQAPIDVAAGLIAAARGSRTREHA